MTSVITKKNFQPTLDKSISREEAEKAVETLIKWAGDDPLREGLKNTPSRVVKSFEEFFSGYNQNAENDGYGKGGIFAILANEPALSSDAIHVIDS